MQCQPAYAEIGDSRLELADFPDSGQHRNVEGYTSRPAAILQDRPIGSSHASFGMLHVRGLVDHEISSNQQCVGFRTPIHHRDDRRIAVRGRFARSSRDLGGIRYTIPIQNYRVEPAVCNHGESGIQLAANLSVECETVESLTHDAKNLLVVGEDKPFQLNMRFHKVVEEQALKIQNLTK